MSNCIDLSSFADRYKLEFDPAATPRNKDLFLLVIPCRHGEIYPFGGRYLAAATYTRGPIAKRLLKYGKLYNDADDGATVVFHVSDFDAIAEIIKPRTRRRLSADHKAKLAEASQRNRISPGSGAPNSRLKRSRAA